MSAPVLYTIIRSCIAAHFYEQPYAVGMSGHARSQHNKIKGKGKSMHKLVTTYVIGGLEPSRASAFGCIKLL